MATVELFVLARQSDLRLAVRMNQSSDPIGVTWEYEPDEEALAAAFRMLFDDRRLDEGLAGTNESRQLSLPL